MAAGMHKGACGAEGDPRQLVQPSLPAFSPPWHAPEDCGASYWRAAPKRNAYHQPPCLGPAAQASCARILPARTHARRLSCAHAPGHGCGG